MREFILEIGYYSTKVLRILFLLGCIALLIASMALGGIFWLFFSILFILTIVTFAGHRVLLKKRYRIDLDGTRRYDVHSSVTHYRRRRW